MPRFLGEFDVLTENLQDKFLTDGYALLPNAIPKDLLVRWQDIAAQREREALQAHAAGQSLKGACVVEEGGYSQLLRYDDLLETDPEALLELLATPALMKVAREFCGRRATALQADILFKHQHPHSMIKWHQGGPHDRSGPYLNVGIYLDDSPKGDGCLKYVPGTQHDLQDISGLSEAHGWDIPGAIEQDAKAGDVLIQDMMILHGSAPKHSPGARRTIYIEYRPFDAVMRGKAQSNAWTENRRKLMGAVLVRANPQDWPDAWRQDYPELSREEETALFQEIIDNPEPPIPSVYSIHPVRGENYPVPKGFTLSS